MELCRERNLEIEILGEKRDNYTIHEYKEARQAADEITAEIEILKAEKQEAEAVIASVDTELSATKELIEESRQHLAEIDTEIAAREKRCAAYEKKLDKFAAAEKPVKKQLGEIKSHSKPLPVVFGGEASVRIPEKDFEKLMQMAQSSGTLEALNKAYDRDITALECRVDKLSKQIDLLKGKVKQFEEFLGLKGLLEEFKEFVRPKSIAERLKGKRTEADKHKTNIATKEKGHDIAI